MSVPAQIVTAKLAGVDGALRWQRSFAGEFGTRGGGLAIDSSDGDVVIALDRRADDEVLVSTLIAGTGSVRWTHAIPVAADLASLGARVATDRAGSALVAITAYPDAAQTADLSVLKLDAVGGTEIWRTDDALDFLAVDRVLVDAKQDVYVNARRRVLKYGSASGALLWAVHELNAIDGIRIAPHESGDVIAAATTHGATSAIVDDFLFVRRIDGATGETLWQQPVNGNLTGDSVASVALAANGLVVGARSQRSGIYDGTVTMGVATRLAGDRLLLREDTVTPQKSLLRLLVADQRFTAPTPGQGAQDPMAGGATLTIENPLTLETAVVTLPAVNWTAKQASKPASYRYKYKAAGDPCTVAVASARKTKVRCKGTLGGFSLDEPAQGTLVVRLVFGTGGPEHCLAFGGDVVRDGGTGGTGLGF